MNQTQLVQIDPTPPAPTPPAQRGVYPLDVGQWGEDGQLLLSRGHHEPETFRRAAQVYCVDELEDTERAGWVSRERVYLEWWRHQPSRDNGRGTEWEGMRHYKNAGKPGPGAFPVTYVSVD